ncbi:type I-E CRISPR-associated protein Cse1/CasA [Thorsellia kenyensis]|uniref:Type I-E CRISPR-associated protein Cse1/CasA n=1 Tax=Thorsellia kenyensis TaxID=1549888 RepID=A0ABV6C744_9GAMM
MNLLKDEFLVVKYKNGLERSITFDLISDPEIVDFLAPRSDFLGAMYQFAIYVLQTIAAPKDLYDWEDKYLNPMSREELNLLTDQIAHAFNLFGKGPLFMQDYDDLSSVKNNTPVASLLIEAPGENTLKQNTDHFIKRGFCNVMSPEMAALSLFTLQINAPSGGQGHRTGLRGGGPLTTILKTNDQHRSLWQTLWLNVLSLDEWSYDKPDFTTGEVFPWLIPTRSSKEPGSEIYPINKDFNIHPLHMYWAMPRRIRLSLEKCNSVCDISGKRITQGVFNYRTINYGHNYSGSWWHPLTPYRTNPQKPEEDNLSVKGQPGGITYQQWQSLLFNRQTYGSHPAKVIQAFGDERFSYLEKQEQSAPKLWAFGFDMDNMKARCWYSTEFPIFYLPIDLRNQQVDVIQNIIDVSTTTLKGLREYLKLALKGSAEKNKIDNSAINATFYQKTELLFFQTVQKIKWEEEQELVTLTDKNAREFVYNLKNIALEIFDSLTIDNIQLGMVSKIKEMVQNRKALDAYLNGYKNKELSSFKKMYFFDKKEAVNMENTHGKK